MPNVTFSDRATTRYRPQPNRLALLASLQKRCQNCQASKRPCAPIPRIHIVADHLRLRLRTQHAEPAECRVDLLSGSRTEWPWLREVPFAGRSWERQRGAVDRS